MVNKSDRKLLNKLLGVDYTKDIIAKLIEKKILNRQGNPHNEQYIRQVMSGHRSNKDIEVELWLLAAKRKKEREKLKKLKAHLKETKKPTALTAG